MSSRTFVIDTDVLVAGLITAAPDSPTIRILDAMLDGSLFFLLSSELLHEYRHVLLRQRIVRIHGLSEMQIEQILAEITANAIWHEPELDLAIEHPPDPRDFRLRALFAWQPGAILITGDRLLIEEPGSRHSVISPAAWAERFAPTI